MNLRENINRSLQIMGVINESKFFERRVDLNKVKSLLDDYAMQVYYEIEDYEQFKYELTLRTIEGIIYDEHGLGWEELPEQEEIEFVTKVSEIFDEKIKHLYNLCKGYL